MAAFLFAFFGLNVCFFHLKKQTSSAFLEEVMVTLV